MKVLMFGWEFPPFITGGLGTACQGLTESLAPLLDQVMFVLPRLAHRVVAGNLTVLGANDRKSLQPLKKALPENILYHGVDSPLTPYLSESEYHSQVLMNAPVANPVGERFEVNLSGNYGGDLFAEVERYAEVARGLAEDEEFEIIHAHDWMAFPAGMMAKQVSKRPLVVHVHATEFDRSGEHVDQRIYDMERAGMAAADRIIAVSHRTKQIIVDHYGVAPDKVRVVHNGITRGRTIERWQSGKSVDGRIVLFLGRVTMQKGPEYFIEAAAKVLARVKDVRFVMAGAGDKLPGMIELMARHRLLDRFHFTGFLQGEQRDVIFAMSDVFVMPSVSEPFGLTSLEAMLYDVPIIVSKQSGVGELLNHVEKVDFWDVDELSETIVRVLADENEAKRLVEDSRQDLAGIDWDRAARALREVYRELV